MMIAMIVPVIFKLLFDSFTSLKPMIDNGELNWKFWLSAYEERRIEHKLTQNSWGGTVTNQDLRNNVLLKAIQLYLDSMKVDYIRAQVNLVSVQQGQPNRWGDDDSEDGKENTPAGKLKKYRMSRKAPVFVWSDIGKSVELRVEEAENDKGEKAEKTQITNVFRFRSRKKGAIDAFITEAYEWYLAELRKMEDNSRYLYEMQLASGGGGKSGEDEAGNASGRTYKRYKLSDDKTFSSLFFEEKEPILAILEHFQNKTGKYAIPGYPHKLGLLLHGPPGTGKTSLIKALAQHTGRNIVNVPLARIVTNQDLMDIMFDQQYSVQGDDCSIRLGFKDVIFVMEDVDAASKVGEREGLHGHL
jgi:hypothetical protein